MLYSGARDIVVNKIYIIYNFKNYRRMIDRKQKLIEHNIKLNWKI